MAIHSEISFFYNNGEDAYTVKGDNLKNTDLDNDPGLQAIRNQIFFAMLLNTLEYVSTEQVRSSSKETAKMMKAMPHVEWDLITYLPPKQHFPLIQLLSAVDMSIGVLKAENMKSFGLVTGFGEGFSLAMITQTLTNFFNVPGYYKVNRPEDATSKVLVRRNERIKDLQPTSDKTTDGDEE